MFMTSLNAFSQVSEDQSLTRKDIYNKFIDSKGYEWYGSRDGLKRFDGYTFETFRSDRNNPELLRSNDVMCIAERPSSHEMWFGTKDGAYILDTRTYKIQELHIFSNGDPVDSLELMDKRINYILNSSNGHIWITYRNQVLELDSLHYLKNRYETQWEGKNRSAIQIVEDSLSSIWTNLWNGGVCRMPLPHKSFIPCQWIDTSYPKELAYDQSKGQITAITTEGKQYHYSLNGALLPNKSVSPPSIVLPYQYISDKDIKHIETLIGKHILCCTKGVDGTLYVGTFDNILSINGNEINEIASNIGRTHDILINESGIIYFISNQKGLCRISGNTLTQIAEGHNFSSLSSDGSNNIWVSNRFGNVYKIPLKSPKTIVDDSIAGNLNGDAIEMIRCDREKRLWIMSHNTLKEYNTKDGGCKIINSKDLSVGTFKAIYLEDNGIYLEGSDSVAHIRNTDALTSQNEITRISISSYTIDGIHTLMPYECEELHIDSRTSSITFFLTSFVYENSKHITYSYSIDGYEYHELEQGSNNISLSNIPYGTSKLYVKGRDSYGRWSDTYDVTTIIHPRPWWHYFLLILVLSAIIVGLTIYRLRAKRFRRKLSERMKRYEQEKESLKEKLLMAEANAKNIGYKESNPSDNYSSLSAQDKEFVDKCREYVEKNLSNIEYGVDALSNDMFMSRMNLYRKLKTIIGKSPTDFIRDIRLDNSLMLLKTTGYSINEISDLVGFSYSSYFTKCFKDKYGKSPKEYVNNRS